MKKIILLFVILIGTISCSNFLDEVDKDKMIPSKVEHYSAVLLKEFNSRFPLYSSIDYMTDNIGEYPGVLSSTKSSVKPLYSWQIEIEIDDNGTYIGGNKAWEDNYRSIATCNYIIEFVDDAEGSQAEKNFVKGEALFSRAWCYFNLQNLYGHIYNPATAKIDLGVALRLDNGIERTYDRSSVKETWDQIEKDLLDARALILASGVKKSVYHASVESCDLLLARTYLYLENWTKAAEYASNIISKRSLQKLVSGTPLLSETSPEVIYAGSKGRPNFGNTWSVSPELMELYNENDSRYSAYFTKVIGIAAKVFLCKKSDRSFNTLNVGGVYLRTAEAYLNRAEAYAHLEMYDEARADILSLLKQRYADISKIPNVSNAELLNFILTERQKELCFEEHHRWFDLRRMKNKPTIEHIFTTTDMGGNPLLVEKFTLLPNDPNYILPIPIRERENNPLIRNNERYDKLPSLIQ